MVVSFDYFETINLVFFTSIFSSNFFLSFINGIRGTARSFMSIYLFILIPLLHTCFTLRNYFFIFGIFLVFNGGKYVIET